MDWEAQLLDRMLKERKKLLDNWIVDIFLLMNVLNRIVDYQVVELN